MSEIAPLDTGILPIRIRSRCLHDINGLRVPCWMPATTPSAGPNRSSQFRDNLDHIA
ncbi:MAG TPA: hypothetical protein VFE41_31375 [Acetobacteraceae bacterium]|nr:hypothetical protein [Acetobacteraceae bacterium]